MTFSPNYIIHPWESLAEALLDRNMTQSEFAQRTWISEKHINQIINSKANITPDNAILFENVLWISMSFWNNLQKRHSETLAIIDAKNSIIQDLWILKEFNNCYKELVKNKILTETKDKVQKYIDLAKFFGISLLSNVEKIQQIAFRKNHKNKTDEYALAARLRLWYTKIEKNLPEFDAKKLHDTLPDLKNLLMSEDNFEEKINQMLLESWVAIVFSPYFKNTNVNWAVRRIWKNPLIQITDKWKNKDWICFTIFHEIWHILLHWKKDEFVEYENNYSDDPKETEANDFASELLIPKHIYDNFVWNAKFKLDDIEKFAKSQNIDKWIIAWRLAKDKYITWDEYRKFRKNQVLVW